MTARKPINCPICGKLITQKKNLNNHIKNKHDNDKNRIKLEKKIKQIRIKFKCELCTNSFTRKYSLQRHINTYHSDSPINVISKKNDQWVHKTIQIDTIDSFIQNELFEFFKKSKKSEYELETNQINQKSIKFIDTWEHLKIQIDQTFDISENWNDFLEHFKLVIIQIKADLYSKLYEKLNNEHYKNLIPIFNRLKISLNSVNGAIWNYQNTKNIVNKMTSF